MAGLLSDRAIYIQTGLLYQHFLTFRKPIYVYKSPTISPDTNSNLYGYQNGNNNFEQTVEPILMSGIRFFPNDAVNKNAELKISSSKAKSYIKVLPADASVLLNYPIDKVVIEGLNYNLSARDCRIQDFLGLQFYMFDIERNN